MPLDKAYLSLLGQHYRQPVNLEARGAHAVTTEGLRALAGDCSEEEVRRHGRLEEGEEEEAA